MFSKTYLTSAIIVALSAQTAVAVAAESTPEENTEVIQVKGIRGSLNKALSIKRDEVQIVDAIVAEDIGKFPDNNVVEALQRLTGVQVTDRGAGEVSTVSIRGLNDVTTTVNGRNIFTASGRSVALADIPASLLGQVNVYKTRSANLLGSGIAGQIDIKTQRPFNFQGDKVVLAARGIYQEQAEEIDPNVSLLASTRWESNLGEFGALVNISYAETNYRDQSVTPGAFVPFATDNPTAPYGAYERIFLDHPDVAENPIWEAGLDQGLSNQPGSTIDINGQPTEYLLSRDAIFQSDYTGKRERPAANISLQWAPNADSEYLFEAFYNGYRNQSNNALLFAYADAWWALDGADAPVTFDGTNIIKERTVYSTSGFTSGDFVDAKTDSYVYALGGKWYLTEDLMVKSELIYQQSEYNESFFAMRFNGGYYGLEMDFNADDGLPAYQYLDNPETADIDESDLTRADAWTVADLYDNGAKRKGEATTLKVDGEYYLDAGIFTKLMFGARYDARKAEESARDITGIGSGLVSSYDAGLINTTTGFFDGEADIPTSWISADGAYIQAHRDEFREMYAFPAEQLALQKLFEVEEDTVELYLQTDFETDLNGHILDGQFGVRYTDVQTDMLFIEKDTFVRSSDDASTTKLLPSLMVRYEITDDVMVRFAYGETLRRPDFAQLNSNINYIEDTTNKGYGTASGGNPNLKPTESKNYDLSLEWYFADTSSVHATLFKREIEGFITDFANLVYYDGPSAAEDEYMLSQPDNASNGELKGAEIGLVYFPDNLPTTLDGFGVQASYTWLDSTQDIPRVENGEVVGTDTTKMFGVSDSSYSVVFAYEKENYDMRLSYVWREDFLAANEARAFANPLGIYRRPETSVDFQLSVDVTEDLVVTFDATNLTNEIYQSYYGDEDLYNLGNAIYSRTFALGARYSF
ncbi:TonB-dependent receptor [Catenovulum sp. 2E275]|uniref:TonB-dependent receptor n=1 Tax=Catenovulum sp. 2E275 TaxID=2980497 RepID=UPI0021D34563|nr:TonB-dependent receptor [Catenovulum sp. 2E275]MCU4676455.1 TonB-dependent receptor [Catenovulum sp. 2E275]